MAVTQLQLYNNALTKHLGRRQLASLTEQRKSRRLLDNLWNNGKLMLDVLTQGSWTFATRSAKNDYSPELSPQYGKPYAFRKPDDWLRTVMVCIDSSYNEPYLCYEDEAGVWYAEDPTIYTKWVSSDPEYGTNLDLWPDAFREWVECYMAWKVCLPLTQDKGLTADLMKLQERLLKIARGRDAFNKPTLFPARGSWATARLLGTTPGGRRRSGGNGEF